MPHALLLKYPGTNCDVETARALNAAGFSTQVQPIATATPAHVAKAQLVVFSGGFSYGDYVMSGRLAQLETERFLGDALQKHFKVKTLEGFGLKKKEAKPATIYRVQVGAFAVRENAERFKAELEAKGYKPFIVKA